ncbi:MAG: hypothetical protein ACI4QM_02240, partial [Alphaproteobacteria bacterium]
MLASCMPTQPFVDSWTAVGAAEKAPRSSADHVAVCYNRYYAADTKQLQALAEEECQKTNRHARYQGGSQF